MGMVDKTTKSGLSRDFVARILQILDWDVTAAADKLGLSFGDIMALYRGSRKRIAAVDQDEFFVRLAEHVDKRIGELLAVREELQRKLNLDRIEREKRRQRIRDL